ncbi:MAG: hypothetical protein ACLFOY_09605 [Desulfatibacillaceae bacterium]
MEVVDGYRKAELVELHDAAVAVHPEEYSDALAGWREFVEEVEHFVIDGHSIAALAEALGWKTHPVVGINTETGQDEATTIANMELPLIRRRRESIGDAQTSIAYEESNIIKQLWARVEAANLLSLRLVIEREEGGKPDLYVQEVTYSGRFTVWWESGTGSLLEDTEEDEEADDSGAGDDEA